MTDPFAGRLRRPIARRDHTRGPADAPVTLVEYGDYECPHCRAAYPIVESLRKRLGAEIQFAYRHFPLTTIHPHAERAAEAAEAAAAQGAFWAMHERLYESGALDDDALLRHARTIEIDIERFRRELAAETYRGRVREDIASGARSGVNGTPTFFVNDARHDGGYDWTSLARAIEEALEGARQEP
jgi:protein-disulfide isomerase